MGFVSNLPFILAQMQGGGFVNPDMLIANPILLKFKKIMSM
jgi:hypothetical protein